MAPQKADNTMARITKELQYKFNQDLTLSPLDLCLKRSIISKETHRYANFFIYLYSVRYGHKRLISHYGYDIRTKFLITDTRREEQQNTLYKKLSSELIKEQSYKIVRDVCIFSILPSFLKTTHVNQKQILTVEKDYQFFIKGMSIISKMVSPIIKKT